MPAFPVRPLAALAIGLGLAAASASSALAESEFKATLAGHAFISAATFIPAPSDAPHVFATSGKFAGPGNQRNEVLYSVEGTSFLSDKAAPRATGLSFPFVGQPVQGFSGIRTLGNGEYLVLIDNGFGSKANSADAMLSFHRVRPDWESGKVRIIESVFLRDPNRVLPFPITTEGTESRYLTGADFDVESIQPIGDRYWIGDEFGPYLIEVDAEGRVLSLHETVVDGQVVRSPDHHGVRMPSTPGEVVFPARRSRGYEGMAASPDGRFLYPMLEGPLWDAAAGDWEALDGRQYLHILEFDVAAGTFTDRSWKYVLGQNDNNIGDFNMIDAERAMVIERDGGEGDSSLACTGAPGPDCFNKPALFKRVYMIDMAQPDTNGAVRKIGYIDLMKIDDPDAKARIGGGNGSFTFPFVTIEDVDRVDANHIIVANDNNLPFSSGRTIGANDHNEFILLYVPDFLNAK